MRKLLLTLAIIMAFGIGANAQFDGFIQNNDNDYSGRGGEISGATPEFPGGTVGGFHTDQPAPVGSGLLILTALGAGYAIRKSRE